MVFIRLIDKPPCSKIMDSDPARHFTKKDRVILGQESIWGMR